VGGHTQFLQLDQSTVCKPLIPRELSFYLNAPPDIRTFTPKCKGKINEMKRKTKEELKLITGFWMDYQVLFRRGIKKGVNTGGDSPWMKSASRPNIRKFRLIKTAVTTPR
jgi:inositol-hexakisphosphate kinase